MIAWIEISPAGTYEVGSLLEIATLATSDDMKKEICGTSSVLLPAQLAEAARNSKYELSLAIERAVSLMPEDQRRMYRENGLIEALGRPDFCCSTEEAERRAIDFFMEAAKQLEHSLAASDEHQRALFLSQTPVAGLRAFDDRRWLAAYMPKLDAALCPRCIDLRTLEELMRNGAPQTWLSRPRVDLATRPVSRMRGAIRLLKHYRNAVADPILRASVS